MQKTLGSNFKNINLKHYRLFNLTLIPDTILQWIHRHFFKKNQTEQISQHSSLRTNTKRILLVCLIVLNYTSEKTLQSKPEFCQHGEMWVRQQYGEMNCSLIEQTFTKALKI